VALVVKINGVDRSSLVLWRSLTWNQALTNQVDTITFQVQKFGSRTFAPSVLDEVTLEDGGTKVFAGNVVKIDESIESVDRQVYSITVKDYTHLMDRRLVIETFEDKPAINIIIEILNRYINRGDRIDIASFESSETWSGGAIDTTNFRLGDRARKLTSTGSTVNMNRNIFLDLQPSGFATSDYIDIDAYVDDVTKLETATLKLGDATLTNYYSKDITADLSATGWNLSHQLISGFSSTGSPDWNAIRKIQIEVKALAGQTVVVTFDNWQVVKSTAFTRNNSFNATDDVKYIAFNYEYPSQCLQRLAELFAWHWYVDEDKDIHFFAKFETASDYNLTDDGGNYVYRSLNINSNADQLRNSIYVRGGDYVGDTLTEDLSQQADGSNKILLLGYKYQNFSLEVNSTAIPVGIDNLDSFTSNLGARQITDGGGAAKVGDVAGNTYQAQQIVVGKQGRRGSVKLRIRKVGTPADNFQVQIFSDDGSNQPSGTNLSAVSSLAGGLITTSFQEFTFSLTESATNDLFFSADDKYHIRCGRSGGADASNYYEVDYVTTAEYEGYAHNGNATPIWTQQQWTWYFIETVDYDVLYSFQEKIITFEVAPSGGATIEWTGDPFFPIFVLYKENNSISDFGEYQYKIIDKSIKTQEGARQRALQEVLSWSEQINEAQFKTYTSGLRAGQTINIQSDIRGLDEDYIIQRIIARGRSGGSLEYTVRCVTTRTFGILYWLQQQIMKDDREIEIADNELEDKIESVFESFGFTTEYTTTLYTGKVWSNDAGTTPNKLIWDGGAAHIWI
jgi:hypothetical protein